jgi:hypothetical protein
MSYHTFGNAYDGEDYIATDIDSCNFTTTGTITDSCEYAFTTTGTITDMGVCTDTYEPYLVVDYMTTEGARAIRLMREDCIHLDDSTIAAMSVKGTKFTYTRTVDGGFTLRIL